MNDTRVRVSVIMGSYNPEPERLRRAIGSLILQTMPQWELILYDDGSDAEHRELIRKAAAADPRIRLLRGKRNRGLAYALNCCLSRAGAEYVARMDDDDVSLPGRLEVQLAFLEAHPRYQWVGSDAELMDADGVWGYQRMPRVPQAKDFLFNSPYLHPTVMFRRQTLMDAGGYSTEKKNALLEDYELFFRLHRLGMRGCNLAQPLLWYREDYQSCKKRTYLRRLREMRLRFRGFRSLGILHAGTLGYLVKPLIVGMIPPPVHHYIRRRIKAAEPARRSENPG